MPTYIRCNANMEKPCEPGTARFGNFINYYSFNPAQRRISLLQDDLGKILLQNNSEIVLHALDVGCNAGELTVALYDHLMKSVGSFESSECGESANNTPPRVSMLGVDVDPMLVSRSKDSNPHPEDISYQHADLMSNEHRKTVIQPWLNRTHCQLCDLLTCFSVTMWIHLNHGDDGLREFLTYISSIARYVILEPQPWKCYRSALRRHKKLDCEPFEHYASLTWRNDVDSKIVDFLQNSCGMQLIRTFGETDWERRVCLFRRVCS